MIWVVRDIVFFSKLLLDIVFFNIVLVKVVDWVCSVYSFIIYKYILFMKNGIYFLDMNKERFLVICKKDFYWLVYNLL